MKVCVIGAGAIGGMLAARLAASGHTVAVVARGAHLQAIQANGLQLHEPGFGSNCSFNAPVQAVAAEAIASLGTQDLVIIALKTQQIAALLPTLAPLIAAHTVVLPAINGLPWWYCYQDAATAARGITHIECLDKQHSMFEALDPARIIGCVVHASAEVTEPGVVRGNGQNKLVVGEPSHQNSARCEQLTQVLTTAGFTVKPSNRIRDDVWMKLVGNTSFNPLAALTQSRMDQLNQSEAIITLVRRLMTEVVAVAHAYGCDPLVGIDERIAIGRSIGPVKVSMHQDLERGRELELDAIVRAPLELGRKAGIDMPFTESVLALADELNLRVVLKL